MESYCILSIFFLGVTLFLNLKEVKKLKTRVGNENNKYLILSQVVIFIGVCARLIYLEYPYGVNQDEAMEAYASWCLAHYGVDQHLMSYPVYFKAWGSGQNALYSYISLPFIKYLGLSIAIFRIPMAILGSCSLFVAYHTFKKIKINSFLIFLFLLFLAFNPWHLSKSRWALESNLAPDLILIGSCIVLIAAYTRQTITYIIGFLIIGLSAYGYAVAWYMLPFYICMLLGFLYLKKRITVKQIVLCFITLLLLVFTLMLFVLKIMDGSETSTFGFMTIPKLNESRHEGTSIIHYGFNQLCRYAKYTIYGLVTGDDKLPTNSIPYIGQFYNPLGWIFILVSFVSLIRNKCKNLNILDVFFFFFLISCIPILISVEYNVNRWNLIWFPLIYFCTKGIYICIKNKKYLQNIFYVVFTILIILYATKYIEQHQRKGNARGFFFNLKELIHITSSEAIDTVYYPGNINYPVFLFYDPMSPYDFYNTSETRNENAAFVTYSKFGKYNVGLPEEINPKEKTAYIIHNENIEKYNINESLYKVKKNDSYTLFWNE